MSAVAFHVRRWRGGIPDYDRVVITNDEPALVDSIFDEHGVVRKSYERRVARDRIRKQLRSWRPRLRIVVRIRLFPKTQKRLDEMELMIRREQGRGRFLQSEVDRLREKLEAQ